MTNPLANRNAASKLVELYRKVDWLVLEEILSSNSKIPTGEKAWPQLTLFKILILDCWSDLEIPTPGRRDRSYFPLNRFVGLGRLDPMPDATALDRFRNRLESEGLLMAALDELNRQIRLKKLTIGVAKDIHTGVVEQPISKTASTNNPEQDELEATNRRSTSVTLVCPGENLPRMYSPGRCLGDG